jgi:hypothetical protein
MRSYAHNRGAPCLLDDIFEKKWDKARIRRMTW